MKTSSLAGLLLAVSLALAAAALAGAADPPAEQPATAYWALAFENDTPKQLVLEDAAGKLRFFWYVVYRVKNPESNPLPARLRLTMRLALEKEARDYDDSFDRVAELHIEKKVLERPVCNWAELREHALKPGETREGIAIFPVGREAPDFDKMTIFVRGLAELRPLGREGNARKFRERILLLRYEQVASQWRAGKELKYLPEEWTLEEVTVADRGTSEASEAEKARQRLDDLLKKAKEQQDRKKGLLDSIAPAPPPAKSSAETAPVASNGHPAPLASDGPAVGKPAPERLADLRKLAAASPPLRATLVETIRKGAVAQPPSAVVTSTLIIGKDGKFALERTLRAGAEGGMQERRVFDGQHLWVQTIAKGVGDTVRRWTVAATKKEWHTLGGKPEVDFATVVNPARAWRLFGDDLVYLGTERLARETAYVFEIRPDKSYEALLGGPLASELLGKALGRRVRFWLGKDSAFQLKMEVYDDRGQAIAALECPELKADAAVPPETFAFKPPAGAEVVDMNAAFAVNDTH